MAYRAPGPGYADVAAHFRDQIMSGTLAPGDLLPSVPEIREQFGVASKTVSRALGMLKSERLVTSRGALGTAVTETPMVITGTDRLDRMAKTGRRYAPGETSDGHRVIRRSVVDQVVCDALDLEPHEEVVIRIRTFKQDGQPTTVGLSVYPPHTVHVVPELADDHRMTRQFDELYAERTGRTVSRGQRVAQARHASQDELDALEISAPPEAAVPVLYTAVAFHDEDRPLAYWEDIYAPGSKVPMGK
ncbi:MULTISPECIES: GntR family transcriptional regulator [Streptomyces]|uniref:GntR family transcriptional regulator n=1 Tax=Streptomyces TaxID=1883 RepID=UPI000282E859|nr:MULTISPECIES: GntR family transcriptional regulator [unclassified Streptomyces]PKA38325.1 GntR family transcriptional regulator [Streptomyces sp. SM8]WSD44282.1 GntR family transcriptional regulator [Streptomyces albidoflavus]